jgi:hypothetical protein
MEDVELKKRISKLKGQPSKVKKGEDEVPKEESKDVAIGKKNCK